MKFSGSRWTLSLAAVILGCGGIAEVELPSEAGAAGSGDSGVSTDAGSGGWTGVDAGTDAAVPCGDPDIMDRFGACKRASNEAECKSSGGKWTRMGRLGTLACNCPTGQGDCPCRAASDCLRTCVTKLDLNGWICSDEQPRCSADTNIFGCYCYVDDEGNAEGVCVD